jgi:hypothetical protein
MRAPMAAVLEAADRSEQLIASARRERQMRQRGYFVALGLATLLLGLLITKSVKLARQRSQNKA